MMMDVGAHAKEQRTLARTSCVNECPSDILMNKIRLCLFEGDILESAVLYNGKRGDDGAFERNFALLLPYYVDLRNDLTPSQKEPLVWGFYLLLLLVQNRIAEFHAAVELLPTDVQITPEVTQAMELEGWMMQGAYENISSARRAPVSPYFMPLLERIVTTVRNEIASCAEAAYSSLRVKDAAAMLGVSSQEELLSICDEHAWKRQGEYVLLKKDVDEVGDERGLPESEQVIQNCLQYAKELERIL